MVELNEPGDVFPEPVDLSLNMKILCSKLRVVG
jgi:hypothetical protein